MASFNELIKSGKIKTAFHKKQAILEDVNTHIQLIAELDKTALNEIKFARREQEATKVLNDLISVTRDLSQLLSEQNREISKDIDFIAEQKHSRSELTRLCDEIEDYIGALAKAGIPYPPDVKPGLGHSDIASIMESLVKPLVDSENRNSDRHDKNMDSLVKTLADNQKEQNKNTDKNISKGSAPKVTQPSFTAKGSEVDFANFADFLEKFKFYVSNVEKDSHKLQWLRQCLKGEALMLIKNLSVEDDGNYKVAMQKLKDNYLDEGTVKHTLLQNLLNFKAVTNPKFAKTKTELINFFNALDELKTVHKLPMGEQLCKELL